MPCCTDARTRAYSSMHAAESCRLVSSCVVSMGCMNLHCSQVDCQAVTRWVSQLAAGHTCHDKGVQYIIWITADS